ncbi:MAG TPA: glycosyltransferase family 2 protein [Candidatus Woesebacteria bacterium]|nr:glycosyltransferase family 2 protein [Candidatus Woesebacteria bacterium]
MINPVLSIIIISYNTSDITVNCLKSIFQDKGLKEIPFEIIIIDNNSQDDSLKKIKEFQKSLKIGNWELKIIENKFNGGFGKANNQGLKIAKGNYILLLNSDTIVLHSAISQSLNWLCSHPEASVCTAQLLNKDKTIQASGGFFPNLINVISWCLNLDDLPFVNKMIKPLHPHTPYFYTHDKFYLKDHQQDWVTGAFMMIRNSHLKPTNGFDENYFMYGEEVELSYRIKKNNPQGQTWYLVGPQIIHLGGASAKNKIDPILNEYLGILTFFKKHKTRLEYKIVKHLIKFNALNRSVIYSLKGNKQIASLYLQTCSKI